MNYLQLIKINDSSRVLTLTAGNTKLANTSYTNWQWKGEFTKDVCQNRWWLWLL